MHISRDFILASANDNLILISYFELNTSKIQVSFVFWLIILTGRHFYGSFKIKHYLWICDTFVFLKSLGYF